MADREHDLIDAAMRFYEQLDSDHAVGIGVFVQSVEPSLRADLEAMLQATIAEDDPDILTPLDDEERALAAHGAQYFDQLVAQQQGTSTVASMTALRTARGLTVAALARLVDLPVDLVARIERGGVRAAGMPGVLLERLAEAVDVSAAEMRRVLAAPSVARAGVRWHARDGTTAAAEEVVDFADALGQSGATAAQREAWS